MQNVVVTGGAGFIGSALVRGLLEAPGVRRVVVVDDLSTGHERNLAEVASGIEFHAADVRDAAALERCFAGADVVFHQAAIPSVPRSIREPVATHDVNVNGTLNVLQAARSQGVRRVVYAASSSAYGDSPSLPKTESMPPRPKSPYAVQKLVGEYYCKVFFEVYGLETVSLRYFNVFGPRQDPSSPYSGVLSLFCTAALEDKAPSIFGDGEQSRDFTYVENIVRLNLLAARSPAPPGKVFNGGAGGRYTLNETWRLLRKLAGAGGEPRYGPPREGDVLHSQAGIAAARRELGYEPEVSFEEGLRRTLEWYRKQRSEQRVHP